MDELVVRQWAAGTLARLQEDRRLAAIASDIRSSGLFDADWYVSQLPEPLSANADPIEHYARFGIEADLSPNPCFVPGWYRHRPDSPKHLGTAAFVHYVRRGAERNLSPHPLFDPVYYLAEHPESAQHQGRTLGHYLDIGWRLGARPAPTFDPAAYTRTFALTDEAPLRHLAIRLDALFQRTLGHEHMLRTTDRFDKTAAAEFVANTLAAFRRLREDPPLVSVVMPTRNRAADVVAGVASVQQQTYRNWQLIVVDDGSTDDTLERLRPMLIDPRIKLVRRERSGGVASARNVGIAHAGGSYLAYLDSDNTWTPEFLDVMVALVRTEGLRFAYAVSELAEAGPGGRHAFRSLPFNREALRERNYIDCVVVVHERSLINEVGHFDETLRRNVDWDLFIRMAEVTDFQLAPFIGTRCDPWKPGTDRIAVNEPLGYECVVIAKHAIDWIAARAGLAARRAGSVSVVVHARAPSPHLIRALRRMLECSDDDVEILVVDAKLDDPVASELQLLATINPRLQVLRHSRQLSTEVGRGLGACHATGEVVVFCTERTWVEPGWLPPLVRPLLSRTAVASQPRILDRDGTTWSAGVGFARAGHPYGLFRGHPGDAPEVRRPAQREGLSAATIAVQMRDLVEVRGFDPIFVDDLDGADLSLRLAQRSGLPLAYVSESVVAFLDSPSGSTPPGTAVDNLRLFTGRWHGHGFRTEALWAQAGYTIGGYAHDSSGGEGFAPIVIRDRTPRTLRWAIKIGARTVDSRVNWGDWHFAVALKEALERLGQEAVIDCRDAWHRVTAHLDDVVLVLRGVVPYTPNPQHLNVLWVISHPRSVTQREVAAYDAAFAASPALARRLSEGRSNPVEVMLQCTDHHRFRPTTPDAVRRHEVLFVGNARGLRPAVRTALAAGVVPAVYGVRWQGLLPAGAWQGEYLPNADLPAVYAGAGAVLNDHWPDMRSEGILSNRLFDLAACGARVVSDDVPGLTDVFGSSVRTFTDPSSLAEALDRHRGETIEHRERRIELAGRVRREHSFDARAAQLVETVQRVRGSR